MQLDSERIRDFKIAQDLTGFPETGEAERAEMLRALCAFHEERLNWRLQRAFGNTFPGRVSGQPRPGPARSPLATKPKGFG
jgi:hypothetical protein